MAQLHFDMRCCPTGWRRDVLIAIEGRRIAAVEAGAPRRRRRRAAHGVAVPGIANLHSHAFQRAMAGLAERRGPEDDSFWTWREVMYRFLARMTPEDVEAIAALVYVEMLEAGFTAVGEFHYLHHAPDGTPYADPAEMAGAHRRGGGGDRHRPDAAAVLLRPRRLRRTAADAAASARFLSDLDGFCALLEASRAARRTRSTAPSSASRRTPCAR